MHRTGEGDSGSASRWKPYGTGHAARQSQKCNSVMGALLPTPRRTRTLVRQAKVRRRLLTVARQQRRSRADFHKFPSPTVCLPVRYPTADFWPCPLCKTTRFARAMHAKTKASYFRNNCNSRRRTYATGNRITGSGAPKLSAQLITTFSGSFFVLGPGTVWAGKRLPRIRRPDPRALLRA